MSNKEIPVEVKAFLGGILTPLATRQADKIVAEGKKLRETEAYLKGAITQLENEDGVYVPGEGTANNTEYIEANKQTLKETTKKAEEKTEEYKREVMPYYNYQHKVLLLYVKGKHK